VDEFRAALHESCAKIVHRHDSSADAITRFEHRYRIPRPNQLSRHRDTRHPGANYNYINHISYWYESISTRQLDCANPCMIPSLEHSVWHYFFVTRFT
jgi:hypothetical protein